MSGKNILAVKVTYKDGTTLEVDAADIPEVARRALETAGNKAAESGLPDSVDRYVLVEWNDGWKETYRLPEDVTDLKRYFVIDRQESVGRLFFNRKDNYPELLQIIRKPHEVKKAYLI